MRSCVLTDRVQAAEPAASPSQLCEHDIRQSFLAHAHGVCRLSDDPSVSVLVLDRGVHRPDDLKVLAPAQWPTQLGDPAYDHGYISGQRQSIHTFPSDACQVPQATLDGKPVYFSAARTLGGNSSRERVRSSQTADPPNECSECHDLDSSAAKRAEGCVADMQVVRCRAAAECTPAWVELGNSSWDWSTVLKHSKEAEAFVPAPEALQSSYKATAKSQYRGENGVRLSAPEFSQRSQQHSQSLSRTRHFSLHCCLSGTKRSGEWASKPTTIRCVPRERSAASIT